MSGFPVIDGVTVVMPPPPGVQPDFAHPKQNAALQHYLVFSIGVPLAFLALCQRFYTKIHLASGLQVDDFFLFLGWAMSILTQGLLIHSIAEHAFCSHAWEIPLSKFKALFVFTYIAAPTFQLCNGFAKLSLLTFYLQLSPQKWFRVATWSSIIVVSLYTAILSLLMFFQCNPVRRAFDPLITEGSCMDAGVLYMATAVTNIITDIILFVLPLQMVLGLNTRGAQKIGAIIIFGIGSLTIATSVVRLVYLPATLHGIDISWTAAPPDVWSFIESNLFIICGSMPTIRKFCKHFMPSLFDNDSNQQKEYVFKRRSRPSTISNRLRGQYPQYAHFPEETNLQVFGKSSAEARSAAIITTGGNISHETEDAHSERAILQTKTVDVQYN